MPDKWRVTVRRNPARLAAAAGGAAMTACGIGMAFAHYPATTTTPILGVGSLVFATSLLLPWVKRVSFLGNEIETHDPSRDEARMLPEAVEELRRRAIEAPGSVVVEELDLPGDDLRTGARYRMALRSIELLLTELPNSLNKCEARLFLWDSDTQRLFPAFRPSSATDPPLEWRLGEGVVGECFRTGGYVVAEGDAVHDATFGLDDERQARFADLKVVAAAPVFVGDTIVGTVALSSKHDGNRLDSRDAYVDHLELSELVASALQIVIDPADDGGKGD